jgi:Ion channel
MQPTPTHASVNPQLCWVLAFGPLVRQPARMNERNERSTQPGGAASGYRFGVVLLLLLMTFVVLMTGSTSAWTRPLTVVLTGATLLAALLAADVSLRVRRIVAVAVAIAAIASLALVGLGRSGEAIEGILDAMLVVFAPIAIARSVYRRRVIDVRTILAALCVYVLLGMLWAFVYTAVGNIGSTNFFAQAVEPTSADYLYFSFITQLTVGYGDLTAAGNLGRSFAVLEALLGQIYLVTIVAVLVSRLVPHAPSSSPDS